MCLSLPGKIVEINGEIATINYGGVTKEANISLLENIQKGDFVLIHVGFAIEKVDEKQARGMYNLLSEQ